MAKEKNILIACLLLFWGFQAQASTVCTTYDGRRTCGQSLVVDTRSDKLAECDTGIFKCKKIAVTNSHLTSGTKVEICDSDWKCTEIQPKNILNNVINDVAVIEIPPSAGISKNGKIKDGKLSGLGVLFSGGNEVSVKAPSWVKNKKDVTYLKEHKTWLTEETGFSTFVVAQGMSGSPVTKTYLDFNDANFKQEMQGLVTGYHNYIPISSFVAEDEIEKLANSFLQGDRGLDQRSERLKAKWHYNHDAKTTFRSLLDETLWETGNLESPTGGGSGTDTGGGSGTDTGGGSGTDTGGGSGTDTGGGSGTDTGGGSGTDTGGGSGTDTGYPCSKQTFLNTEDFKKLSQFYGLYHGVIINNKQVIGFVEKETGRIVQATWDLLASDDVAQGKYEKYTPYFENQLDLKKLLLKNRPELSFGKARSYCIGKTKECVELTLLSNNTLKISSKGKEVIVDLKNNKSATIFKNVPIKYATGKESSIWLADLFLPDARLDAVRAERSTFVGGNHKTKSLDILTLK